MEGTYKLAEDTTGKCALRLKEEEGGKLRVSLKVANSMNVILSKTGDKWTGGPVMSTKGGIIWKTSLYQWTSQLIRNWGLLPPNY